MHAKPLSDDCFIEPVSMFYEIGVIFDYWEIPCMITCP